MNSKYKSYDPEILLFCAGYISVRSEGHHPSSNSRAGCEMFTMAERKVSYAAVPAAELI